MRSVKGEMTSMVVLIAIEIGLVILASVLGLILLPTPWSLVPMFAVNVVLGIGTPVYLILRSRTLRARLQSMEGRICPGCGQSLVGLGDEGTCPECGVDFEIGKVRKRWGLVAGEEGPPGRPKIQIPKSAIAI